MDGSKRDDPDPTYEEIARRAYELFEGRGRAEGATWDDWIAAEQQLRAERKPTPAGPSPKDTKPRPPSRPDATGPQRPKPSRRS